MLRRLVALSVALLAAPALAQSGPVLEPGVRVRAIVPSHTVPPSGGVLIGDLVSVGDTLAIRLEGGESVVRVVPAMRVGLDVSEARPRMPLWIPLAGAGGGPPHAASASTWAGLR